MVVAVVLEVEVLLVAVVVLLLFSLYRSTSTLLCRFFLRLEE